MQAHSSVAAVLSDLVTSYALDWCAAELNPLFYLVKPCFVDTMLTAIAQGRVKMLQLHAPNIFLVGHD
jgi:hypothetical protein